MLHVDVLCGFFVWVLWVLCLGVGRGCCGLGGVCGRHVWPLRVVIVCRCCVWVLFVRGVCGCCIWLLCLDVVCGVDGVCVLVLCEGIVSRWCVCRCCVWRLCVWVVCDVVCVVCVSLK